MIDLTIRDHHLGFAGAATRFRPVALGLDGHLAIINRSCLGQDDTGQDHALSTFPRQADLGARSHAVGHFSPPCTRVIRLEYTAVYCGRSILMKLPRTI